MNQINNNPGGSYQLLPGSTQKIQFTDNSSTESVTLSMGVWSETSEKIDGTKYHDGGTDAEWYKSGYLSKQITFFNAKSGELLESIILWHSPIPPSLEWLESEMRAGRISRHNFTIILCPPETRIMDVVQLGHHLNVHMYYSPRDVEGLVGRKAWYDALITPGTIQKKRNLTGVFTVDGTKLTLKDWAGAFNCSLASAMKSVGVNNPYKSLVEDTVRIGGESHKKDRMDLFMGEARREFLLYAAGDTVFLPATILARVKQVNEIVSAALDFNPNWTVETFPRSAGSLVAKTFESWLMHSRLGLMKSLLRLTTTTNNKYWPELKKGVEQIESDPWGVHKKFRGDGFIHGMAAGSIKGFGKLCPDDTGIFNAVVMGGRCVNEEPYENPKLMRVYNVIDVDLSGCYGSALKLFDMPFGIPTVFGRRENDVKVTLGEFLEKYQRELVTGLYRICVSGRLSFEQDLIHSKYDLTTLKIKRTIINDAYSEDDSQPGAREDNDAHVGGKFLLTKKQIELGILTHDVLEILKAVSTNDEWSELMNLEVVAASYYPKSKEVSVEEFNAIVENPVTRGGITFKKGDTRTRNWCRIPLSEFITPFIQLRKEFKKLSLAKGDEFDLKQNAVKLFINTTYGNLASPYFPMGNTILANNITAKARVGVWMMSKALLTKQSITDGGMFSYDTVASLKPGEKKPGLHAMADRQRFLSHRAVKVVPLGDGVDWYEEIKKAGCKHPTLDKVVSDHINKFWGHYGLKLPFDIECKQENTARKAQYFGSSDYYIPETLGGMDVFKTRGAKEDDHPKKEWLKWLLGVADAYTTAFFEYIRQLGVGEFQANPAKWGDLLPGYDVLCRFLHKPFRYGKLYQDYQEYQSEDKSFAVQGRRAEKLVEENPELQNSIRVGLAKKLQS